MKTCACETRNIAQIDRRKSGDDPVLGQRRGHIRFDAFDDARATATGKVLRRVVGRLSGDPKNVKPDGVELLLQSCEILAADP
jgi:hypothetical protein